MPGKQQFAFGKSARLLVSAGLWQSRNHCKFISLYTQPENKKAFPEKGKAMYRIESQSA
jgi:hypothetical protein